MSAAEGAGLLGLAPGMVVEEVGWDDDVDAALRDAIMDTIDADMVEESLEGVDVVVLWWRDDDGDVADGLVEAMTDLAPTGFIWLMTPKVGRAGFIETSDLSEGSVTAGLALTGTMNVSTEWQATKVVRPKSSRR